MEETTGVEEVKEFTVNNILEAVDSSIKNIKTGQGTGIQMSEEVNELFASYAKFQAEVTNPYNTKENPFLKNKYSPLDEVLNTVRPVLAKHGLAVMQIPTTKESMVEITSMLIHSSGQWMLFEPIAIKPDKNTAQGIGGAITYGRRYAVTALAGVASENDDDGNEASGVSKPKSNQSEKPKKDPELVKAIKEIDKLGKEAMANDKISKDDFVALIKKYHTGANYNTIKDIKKANGLLKEIKAL